MTTEDQYQSQIETSASSSCSLPKFSLTDPSAPTLKSPQTVFDTTKNRSAARTAAVFYSKCSIEGIPAKDADDAALESHSAYRDWWRQERFTKGGNDTTSQLQMQLSRCKRRFSDLARQNLVEVENTDEVHLISEAEEECEEDFVISEEVGNAKNDLLQSLSSANGDTNNAIFSEHLQRMSSLCSFSSSNLLLSGVWVTLSRPDFKECLGQNESGEFIYTLGRMAFDMFRPTNLRCNIQGIFTVFGDVGENVDEMYIPWNIRKQALHKIRSYNIAVAFTIEPPSTASFSRPLRALLTNHGYILPDLFKPRRHSFWFTHGILEEDHQDFSPSSDSSDDTSPSSTSSTGPSLEWTEIFGDHVVSGRNAKEKARILAAQVLLGASIPDKINADGSMEYWLKRPIGGYLDTFYVDHTLQICKGNLGSIFVLHRI